METENKDQELETAAVTLADGMHFVGNIEGFRLDLDANWFYISNATEPENGAER